MMKTTTWLLPWKAKAEILSLNGSVKHRDEAVESLKNQLHTAATQLTQTRKSEQEWQAVAEDNEKALHNAVERINILSQRPENSAVVALNQSLSETTEALNSARRIITEREQRIASLEDFQESSRKANEHIQTRAALAESASVRITFLERQLGEANLAIKKLRDWITTTHKLRKPSAEGTIKAMLEQAQRKQPVNQ